MHGQHMILVVALWASGFLLLTMESDAQAADRPKNYQLVNGRWFDGAGFSHTTCYSVDGG